MWEETQRPSRLTPEEAASLAPHSHPPQPEGCCLGPQDRETICHPSLPLWPRDKGQGSFR